MKIKMAFWLIVFLGSNSFIWSQDIDGSSDYEGIDRIPSSWIKHYDVQEFDRYSIATTPQKNHSETLENKKDVEGKITRIAYSLPYGKQSPFSIYRNYQNALQSHKGTTLFSCYGNECNNGAYLRSAIGNSGISLHSSADYDEDFGYYAYEYSKDGTQYFIIVMTGQFSYEKSLSYEIHIIEVKEMEQVITLDYIASALDEEGRMAFYDIQFRTGSSELLPDAQNSIAFIAQYLKENPSKKIYVVGHTDNTGSHSNNMDLSQKRAEAVVRSLTSQYGIPSHQLQAEGVGPLAPVATNATDKGRQKNRRVEVVIKN